MKVKLFALLIIAIFGYSCTKEQTGCWHCTFIPTSGSNIEKTYCTESYPITQLKDNTGKVMEYTCQKR